jgi:hypothetical protein
LRQLWKIGRQDIAAVSSAINPRDEPLLFFTDLPINGLIPLEDPFATGSVLSTIN